MPIESRSEDTGIFTRESAKATGPNLRVALRGWAEKHNALWSNWLDWAEAAAEAVLADPEAPANSRRDAHLVKGHCRALRHYLDCGDTREAAFQAFELGRIVTRLEVRPREPDARLGGQVREGRRQGHAVAHGTREQKERRWALYQRTIDAAHAEHPKCSHWAVCRIGARQFTDAGHKVSARTIWRHTSLPKSD